MSCLTMKKVLISSLALFTGFAAVSLVNLSTVKAQAKPTVITLTQVACQFVEAEAKDYNFTTRKADDCKAINSKVSAERKKGLKTKTLKPGDYVFRVKNVDVPYELGFYLRGTGLKGATLPRLSGGGLTQGKTMDYKVSLKPGSYVFSCPLNPTLDYSLVVK